MSAFAGKQTFNHNQTLCPLNTESGRSSLSIEIQKYELPHMEVDIKIDSRRVINSRLSYDDDVFE